MIGKSTFFDGINDYIEIPHSNSLDLWGRWTAWTINYKFNVFSGSKVNIVIAKNDDPSENYSFYSYFHNGILYNSIAWSWWYNSNPVLNNSYYNLVNWLWVNIFYNITLIYNRTVIDNTTKLYIDWKFISEKIIKDANSKLWDEPKNIKPIRIWINALWMPSWYFNGLIDDIKIYNRALSDDEIKQHAKIAGF